jgi:hypothetical protein
VEPSGEFGWQAAAEAMTPHLLQDRPPPYPLG